jgi:anti-sigma B factor antagonist
LIFEGRKEMPRPHLDLRYERAPDTLLICATGELELTTAQTLEDALLEAIDQEALLIVDLSELRFIDSSGLRVLAQGRKRAHDRGSHLRFIAPPGTTARKLLDLTRLRSLFAVYDDVDAALAGPSVHPHGDPPG